MKAFLAFLKTKKTALVSVIFLLILYIVMIFAPFFAPYDAARTFENNTYHPANLQLTFHGFKVREFRPIDKSVWKYVRVKDEETIHGFRLFVHGSPYRLFGFIKSDIHLFGSDSDYPVYLLGADNLGRDLFSRIVYGSRISLTIGILAVFVSLIIAVLLGGVSGYFGSTTDWFIMRFAEFFMLIPDLYFILFLRSILNSKMDSGKSYMIITLILSLVGWPGLCRTIRGMVHSIKREEFVTDAELSGIPSVIIIFRHIIPQILSYLIIVVAMSIPGSIMSETALSYLGLGIADPAVSWGSLINRDAATLSNLAHFPWLLFPVLMLILVTLSFNFFADALRDYFDPNAIVFKRRNRKSENHKRGKSLSLASTVPFSATHSSGETPQRPVTEGHICEENEILSVENLKVNFTILRGNRKTVIEASRGVSFKVYEGEILGLVGESGSGKSVSTSAIPCLLPENAEYSGHIYFRGTDLFSLDKNEIRKYRGKKIALIFQEPGRSFDPLQTIGSVFLETFRIDNPSMTEEEGCEKAVKLLCEVGIPDPEGRLKAYPHQFSGGQLQRIGIALALSRDPELLIADEPTTALDVTIQAQIVSLLLKLKKERNLSIIFISHNINLVAQIADRICVMYHGKIKETGKSRDVMTNPSHPYTKALLASLPRFGTHYTESPMETITDRSLFE